MATKYENISMLFETTDFNAANEKLAVGYKILNIYSAKSNLEGLELIKPIYVLGLELKK